MIKKYLAGMLISVGMTCSLAGDNSTLKSVTVKASCAIEGYTATHAKQIALQQARREAINEANGNYTQSFTVIKNGALAIDMIQAFASGFIVEEKQHWSSKFFDHDDDPSTAEIPEYIVTLDATVKKVPKEHHFILTAELDKSVYTHGDAAQLRITSAKDVQVALFYYGSDDNIYRIIPNDDISDLVIPKRQAYVFPPNNSEYNLEMQTLPNYEEVSEALIVIAVPQEYKDVHLDEYFFKQVYGFNEFFRDYSKIAHVAIERIVPYRVFARN